MLSSQNWFFEPVDDKGYILDITYNYKFQNEYSRMVLDMAGAKIKSRAHILNGNKLMTSGRNGYFKDLAYIFLLYSFWIWLNFYMKIN